MAKLAVLFWSQTFLLGLSNDPDVMRQIDQESDLYGDVLQFSIIDSYYNLTYKTLGAYEWIYKVKNDVTCPKPNFCQIILIELEK